MKTTRCFLLTSLLLGGFTSLLANTPENAERAATLRSLVFTHAKQAAIARLAAPTENDRANFHGSRTTSRWVTLPNKDRDELIASLRSALLHELTTLTQAGNDTLVFLQPMGVVYGDYAVRLETETGVREFVVCLPEKWDGYIYVYDDAKHRIGLSPGREFMLQLQRFRPQIDR